MDPVFILIRTSGRPKMFKTMMKSVKAQTYKPLITIVHSDDRQDQYVEGDLIIHGDPFPDDLGSAPYNLYCNRLLDAIPDLVGWYFFLDDDEKLHEPETVDKIVAQAKRDHLNATKAIWGTVEDPTIKKVYPDDFVISGIVALPTCSFFLHTDHKHKARWPAERYGDYKYTSRLNLPVYWIDLIRQEQQISKGYGKKEGDNELC